MNDIFKETFGGVKKSVATALVDVKDFRIPLPNIKANLSFFNFNDEDTKRLEEKKKELKEIELAQSSLSVKRICVGISGLLTSTNVIIGMVCLSLVNSKLTQEQVVEEGFHLFLEYTPVRIIMFVLTLLAFISYAIRILNIKIVMFTILTILFSFLTVVYGVGITAYIIISDGKYGRSTKVPDDFVYFIIGYITSFTVLVLITYDYISTKDFRNKGSGISYKQKMFIFSVTLMYTWVMVGGVGFKYLEGDTFLSGVYFCLITVTAIGNSDIGPTTIQSQVIMMLWTIVATVVMGIYFINYTNFLLSLLETMKTNKLAKLLKKQVLLKIQHTQNRLESRSNRRRENPSLEHTKTSYDDVNLTRTRFNASARSSIVGDDFYGSENLRPISRTAKSELNLYSLDGMHTSFKDARDAPSSIDSGFHLRKFSKEENVLEFDLIEEELEKLKNSPRLTMEIAIFIIVCILVWFGVISIFFAFRNKSYTFFEVFYYSFITYSTIGFGKNIYESDGEMIYFCIQVLLMVSLFGVFIAGISDFVQSWLTSIIKPEETDKTKRTETDKILSKVHKLLKRR